MIFWQLCTVDKLNESSRIVVEDFDLEAELQARIWHQFMRNATFSVADDSMFKTEEDEGDEVKPEIVPE